MYTKKMTRSGILDLVIPRNAPAENDSHVHFGKICGCDELISHLGDCHNGVVRVAA